VSISCTVEVSLEELDKPVIDVIWNFKTQQQLTFLFSLVNYKRTYADRDYSVERYSYLQNCHFFVLSLKTVID